MLESHSISVIQAFQLQVVVKIQDVVAGGRGCRGVNAIEPQAGGGGRESVIPNSQIRSDLPRARTVGQLESIPVRRRGNVDVVSGVDRVDDIVNRLGKTQVDHFRHSSSVGDTDSSAFDAQTSIQLIQRDTSIDKPSESE